MTPAIMIAGTGALGLVPGTALSPRPGSDRAGKTVAIARTRQSIRLPGDPIPHCVTITADPGAVAGTAAGPFALPAQAVGPWLADHRAILTDPGFAIDIAPGDGRISLHKAMSTLPTRPLKEE